MYLELFEKQVLVVGCGNPLLGDDGFGPAVIESLETQNIFPDSVGLVDAGTSVREILFDLLLSENKPEKLIVIDAVQQPDVRPGRILEIDIEQIPDNKIADYCLHQFPTTNMLRELMDSALMDLQIFAVQMQEMPQRLQKGLSPPVENAVPQLCAMIKKIVECPVPGGGG